jgi:hypothetical protein
VDRFSSATVFTTGGWHEVTITIDRRVSNTASLKVDSFEDTAIPLTNWDPTSDGMRCLFLFSGVTDDTVQDLWGYQVDLRARPGGAF